MIRIKKQKVQDEKNVETNSDIKTASVPVAEDVGESSKGLPEVTQLPVYRINLKKTVKSDVPMKGTSLNLLGGYDSGSSSNEES